MSDGGDACPHPWGLRGASKSYNEPALASKVGSDCPKLECGDKTPRPEIEQSVAPVGLDCLLSECRDKTLRPDKRQSDAPRATTKEPLPCTLVDVLDTSNITMHGMAASMIRRVLAVRPSKLVRYFHTCLGLSKTLLTFRDADSLPKAAKTTKLFPLPLPFPHHRNRIHKSVFEGRYPGRGRRVTHRLHHREAQYNLLFLQVCVRLTSWRANVAVSSTLVHY